ncbi:phage major capsid protein [Rhodoferax sp. GW822-FHT02A01]|uniref:phage major capsid protein n=1 Tax=Rhodoferax sp. GW822-FHT02A01 TaxID=3141537 RepID=UPI00315D68F8
MSKKLRELQARKSSTVTAMRAITDKASAESREPTAEENEKFKSLRAEAANIEAAIEREQDLIALEKSSGVVIPDNAHIATEDNRNADATGGFKSFGEFASAVIQSHVGGGRGMDDRLRAAAPTTFGNEAAGADGGFVVPPQYSSEVFALSLGEDAFIPMTDNTEISGNSMVFPKTEQTPWGSNGVRAYWQAEAATATATKPVLGVQAMRMHKLMTLVPLSDELVADTNALDSLVPRLIGDSIRWKTNEAILNGNGNGQPMGALLSTGPSVMVPKDSGQAANTLSATNLFNMVSRMPPGSYQRAVWLIHPTVIPVLATLVLGNIPVFLPAAPPASGAMTMTPYFGTILGRPCLISHHAATLSSLGDVQLHDMSYYRTITKPGGVQMAQSLHLYFDADALALRAVFRIDGGPKIASAISPAKGSTTLSPFLQLQNR